MESTKQKIPKPKSCPCTQPNWRDFSCKIHWHDKEKCDETHTEPMIGDKISDARLRTILHGFGWSHQRPNMFSNVTEREGEAMAYELLNLRAILAELKQEKEVA